MSNEVGDLLEQIGGVVSSVNEEADKIGAAIKKVEARLKEMGAGAVATALLPIDDEDRHIAALGDHVVEVGLQYQKASADWKFWVAYKTKHGHVISEHMFGSCSKGWRILGYRALSAVLKEIIKVLHKQQAAGFPTPEAAWAELLPESVKEDGLTVHDFHAEQLVVVTRDQQGNDIKADHTVIVDFIDKDFVHVNYHEGKFPVDPADLRPATYQIGDIVHLIGHGADDGPVREIVGYHGNTQWPYRVEGFSSAGFNDEVLEFADGFVRPTFGVDDLVFLTEDSSSGYAKRGDVGIVKRVAKFGVLLQVGDNDFPILNHRLQHAFAPKDKVIVLDEDGEDTEVKAVVLEHEGPHVKIHVNGGDLNIDPGLLRIEIFPPDSEAPKTLNGFRVGEIVRITSDCKGMGESPWQGLALHANMFGEVIGIGELLIDVELFHGGDGDKKIVGILPGNLDHSLLEVGVEVTITEGHRKGTGGTVKEIGVRAPGVITVVFKDKLDIEREILCEPHQIKKK